MKLEDIPFDDHKTFELISSGQTEGVFQIGTSLGKVTCRQVQPSNFEELTAILALTRPGSLDNDGIDSYVRKKLSGSTSPDIHPDVDGVVEPLLRETFGVILYQEQLMKVIAAVSGWGYSEADDLFNAMRKKKLDKMESAKPGFYAAAESRGISRAGVDALWGVMVPFSDYSFNLAHSVGYAYISYRGAYLKTHHPREYLSAMLTRASDITEVGQFIREARRMGDEVLPPDVNKSDVEFRPEPDGLRFGLASIKGVGVDVAAAVVGGRPFRDVDEFFRRADSRVLDAGVCEALIKAGALDSLWGRRSELLEQSKKIAQVALTHRKAEARGQRPVVGVRYRPHHDRSWSAEEDRQLRNAWELELLGGVLRRSVIVLKPSRPLAPEEWLWIRQSMLGPAGGGQVRIEVGGKRVPLGVNATISQDLVDQLDLLQVEVTEE